MKFYFLVICFLIFSCDLPNEADADCSGINMGSAFIDDCGRCVGESTGFIEGHDKDDCGVCYGNNSCLDGLCVDATAINYHSELPDNAIADNSLCIYDVCQTLPSNDDYTCNENDVNYPYQIGQQLNCNDLETSLNICFPDNCDNTVTLGDYYGKVIWFEMTSSWWATCVSHLPGADAFIAEYLDNPNFAAIAALMDVGQPHSCSAWGNFGNNKLPLLIDGGSSLTFGNQNGLESLFFTEAQIPKRVFIDHEMRVYDIVTGYMSQSEIKLKIDEMLSLME